MGMSSREGLLSRSFAHRSTVASHPMRYTRPSDAQLIRGKSTTVGAIADAKSSNPIVAALATGRIGDFCDDGQF